MQFIPLLSPNCSLRLIVQSAITAITVMIIIDVLVIDKILKKDVENANDKLYIIELIFSK